MEELKYIVEDRTIARLLGVENFTNKESAILELIKNAFDAKALNVKVIFDESGLTIKDDGNGMTKDDILRHWMHVGRSNKGYQIEDENGNIRVLAGSKGVGRFALARLGSTAEVRTYREGSSPICWKTDWGKSTLESVISKTSKGTEIIIEGLRDRWSEKAVINLLAYLGLTYNDDVMDIEIIYKGQSRKVNRYFKDPKMGENYTSHIKLEYDCKKSVLKCSVDSDEFRDEAQQYCKQSDIHHFEKDIDMLMELSNEDFNNEIEDLDSVLKDLGSFHADFYFGLEKVLSGDDEKFLYKRKDLAEKFDAGVILFRNSFSISSYEGKRDWLEFGKRSRKSPAAATHPTGSWRVRENQISGKVNIDKIKNPYLQDLSNRQGLDENSYYNVFVRILQEGIAEFEYYRQGLIRSINIKNQKEVKKDKKVIDKIIKNPKSLKSLSKLEEDKLVGELKDFKKESKEFKKNIDSTEKRYKYDVRILNVLATSGLKATSIAHEMKNDRNNIAQNHEFIVKALVQYGMWDALNSPEKTRFTHVNVPSLLNSNKAISQKIVRFMDTMLEEVEKRQFFAEEHNIKILLEAVKNNWVDDYKWVNIDLDINENILYVIPEDIVKVIFDNLILNSIQQNENMNPLKISIKISRQGSLLNVQYKDNGRGLSGKFINSPRLILEPHETSRKNGHGLGMWIINNTLNMSGGEVSDIVGDAGFSIDFKIGDKL